MAQGTKTKPTSKNKEKKSNTQTSKKSDSNANTSKVENSSSKGIILFIIAIFITFLILIKGENFWLCMHNFCLWLGGWLSISIPVLLIYLAISIAKGQKKVNYKFSMITSITVLSATVINLFASDVCSFPEYFAKLTHLGSNDFSVFGTGLLGNIVSIPLRSLMGDIGARITCILLLALFIMLFAGITVINITDTLKKPVDKIKVVNEQYKQRVIERKNERESLNQQQNDKVMIDIPLDGEVRKRDKRKKADRLVSAVIDVNKLTPQEIVDYEDRVKKAEEEQRNIQENMDFPDDDYIRQAISFGSTSYSKPEAQQQKVPALGNADEIRNNVPTANEDDVDAISDTNTNVERHAYKVKPVRTQMTKEQREEDDIASVPIDLYKTVTSSKKETALQTIQYSKEIDEEIRKNAIKEEEIEKVHKFPSVELLSEAKVTDDTGVVAELHENARKLIETLDSFNVKAKILNICRGPSVTRYEIQPAPGVKISKITNLADDIALNLAALGVRIEAPIPGKAAVGIEVPNKTVSMVSMRELIDSDTFRDAKSKLSCVIGRDISGNIFSIDLAKLPHLLIAGTTGSGKSVCVNSILLSILYKATPDEVKLILIDPKMVEFSKYKSVPHLLIPVVSDPKKAAGALNWAVNEMLERYRSFSECGARDIHGYNKIVENNLTKMREAQENGEEDTVAGPTKKLEQIVIAIDELSDLMMAAPKEVEDAIFRLAQMARAAGMHLVIATQRPSVDVITGVIKANIPSRIALKVSSQTDSRTILDAGGADKLIGKGDMLCMPIGISKPIRVQGGYASDEEIEKITDFFKQDDNSPEFNEDVIEQIDFIAESQISSNKKNEPSSEPSGDADPLTEDAIKCVVEAGEASVSLLQRRLKVGYARAGRLVDDLEAMGIVGPHEGSKKRKVLLTYQQWLERSGNM
ncbi:MAG: DNA translocase FtsK 4TM domain-containing protein [Clostridia bacterium]|nr:DNA translocase FtsK 4TM domain-containing protein [Clostridia bacterium]